MKKSVFSKFASVAAVAVISVFFLAGCAEDPANNNGGRGGGYDNPSSDSGGGGTPISYTISELTIKNSTSYTVNGIYVKPSISTDWGSNLYNYSSLADGQSRKLTFSKPLSATNGIDVQLKASSGGYTFTKYKVTVSNGATMTFTASDLNDESNLPSITIQNRTGINFNAIYIRPSSVPDESSDWGKDYGSLSNNNDESISIPIPSSSYTTFDIQMRSSNPANTYTKKNVAISNGMVLTYTSADSDNPLIGSPIIVLQNNTGYTVNGIYIKPSTSTDWGSNLYGYSNLADGKSRTFTLSQSLSANSVYDIQLKASSGGYTFTKYDVTVSEGIIINFTSSDLE
jgi:plastocyanin